MQWPEPVRRFESPEDKELRSELAELLGYSATAQARGGIHPGASNFFGVKPTPELVALAEKLRAEAQRRRNTSRHRSGWMLLAAGLPIALALSGLGGWGLHQKTKADQAAAVVQQLEEKQRHAKDASQRVAESLPLAGVEPELPQLPRLTLAPPKRVASGRRAAR